MVNAPWAYYVDTPVLVAGARRLAACKSLGWSEIPATVVELNDIDLELAEIDENLIREDLTALERGEQLLRRKWIFGQKGKESGNFISTLGGQTCPQTDKRGEGDRTTSLPVFLKPLAGEALGF